MKHVRQVIKVGATYYLSLPKSMLSIMGVFRGSLVLVWVEGTRIVVETDAKEVKEVSWNG